MSVRYFLLSRSRYRARAAACNQSGRPVCEYRLDTILEPVHGQKTHPDQITVVRPRPLLAVMHQSNQQHVNVRKAEIGVSTTVEHVFDQPSLGPGTATRMTSEPVRKLELIAGDEGVQPYVSFTLDGNSLRARLAGCLVPVVEADFLRLPPPAGLALENNFMSMVGIPNERISVNKVR